MKIFKLVTVNLLILCLFLSNEKVSFSEPQIKYIAIGDSLTAGLGASEVNYLRIGAFVPSFVKYLREEKGFSVDVENHGIPGLTSAGFLANIHNSKGLQEKIAMSNLITVTIGGNDFLQLIRSDQTTLANAKQRLVDLEKELNNIHALLRSINSTCEIYYIGLYNPYPENHTYYDIAETIVPLYNDLLSTVTKESNSHLLNPYDVFLNNAKALTHISKDDIHPNDLGYQKITAKLIQTYSSTE
ncbi:GDSL-type esterase/lipase family protein [Lottiidibacillus patelloidae]|nr:GDSL-type esterase/lipase family protein [Lottiidibacillus patelloidae]